MAAGMVAKKVDWTAEYLAGMMVALTVVQWDGNLAGCLVVSSVVCLVGSKVALMAALMVASTAAMMDTYWAVGSAGLKAAPTDANLAAQLVEHLADCLVGRSAALMVVPKADSKVVWKAAHSAVPLVLRKVGR